MTSGGAWGLLTFFALLCHWELHIALHTCQPRDLGVNDKSVSLSRWKDGVRQYGRSAEETGGHFRVKKLTVTNGKETCTGAKQNFFPTEPPCSSPIALSQSLLGSTRAAVRQALGIYQHPTPPPHQWDGRPACRRCQREGAALRPQSKVRVTNWKEQEIV